MRELTMIHYSYMNVMTVNFTEQSDRNNQYKGQFQFQKHQNIIFPFSFISTTDLL